MCLEESDKIFGKPIDVWALGCTFYQMIYSRFPFEGGLKSSDLANSLINSEVDFPELKPGIQLPDACKDLISKMLCKEYQARITVSDIMGHPYVKNHIPPEPSIGKLQSSPDDVQVNPSITIFNALKKIITNQEVQLQMKKNKK